MCCAVTIRLKPLIILKLFLLFLMDIIACVFFIGKIKHVPPLYQRKKKHVFIRFSQFFSIGPADLNSLRPDPIHTTRAARIGFSQPFTLSAFSFAPTFLERVWPTDRRSPIFYKLTRILCLYLYFFLAKIIAPTKMLQKYTVWNGVI